MKNLIILIIGLIILITLLIFASTKFDSTSGEFSSDTYVWNIDENTETSEIESETAIREAKDFYDFTVEDASGNLVKKSDIAGKPMIIHFWASWCGYCLYELPALQNIYDVYGDNINFMIVCITDGEYETVESAKSFLSDKGYTLPIYFDVNSEALHNYQLYDLSSVSRTYLFDINGNYVSKANKMVTEDILEEGVSMILP